MSDEEFAKAIVREVFMTDLKGDVGHLARRAVPLEDRQDIAKRIAAAFAQIRDDERARAHAP